jgi:uncharacterized protein (TIGR02466 family)
MGRGTRFDMRAPVASTPELQSLFATPMLRWRAPDHGRINPDLKALILARATGGEESRISNFGGWQSLADFLETDHPAVSALNAHIQSLLRMLLAAPVGGDLSRVQGTLTVKGWANVNRDGDYNRIHNHAENHWSGVYYVDLGRPRSGVRHNGAIEFLDPRPSAGAAPVPGFNLGTPLTVTPKAGDFILFPSWLQHGVLPFRGEGERISIAFNAIVTGYRAG